MRMLLAIALLASAGCANLVGRAVSSNRNGPYGCMPHPYAATADVFDDCVLAPFRTYKVIAGHHTDPVGDALCTLTWPFWIVDEVGEIVLDTVFLPVDSVYYFFFREENQR